jgi:uncharacterized damage-inducible protein DinB
MLRRSLDFAAVLFLGALLCASVVPPAVAQEAGGKDAVVPGLRGELLRSLDDARAKTVELAQVTPEKKYNWRPGKGVRSTGEVFMHIAQTNYMMPLLLGAAPAPGVDARGLDKLAGDKARVLDALRGSFEYAMQAMRDLPDGDLEQTVDIFGRQGTKRELCMLLVAHAHEHLGQSIAYARTNGIVPPWTARAEAEAAAKKAQGK